MSDQQAESPITNGAPATASSPDRQSRTYALAIGFGTSVAVWTACYVCLAPPIALPDWVLFGSVLALLLAGGVVAGRFADRGFIGGAIAGLVTAVVNLLILGSVLGGEKPTEIAGVGDGGGFLWVPGSLVASIGLGAIGAFIGARWRRRRDGSVSPDWTAWLARVLVVATLLLIVAGGFVTSADAGLAVPDWPSSFGYNMFLFPVDRMVQEGGGNVFYEHAHRLLGTLVGLVTLVLCLHVWFSRGLGRSLKVWMAIALVGVIVQGIFGGLRVTGQFTTEVSREAMTPSLVLAMVHGVIGQAYLCLAAALAAAASRQWQRGDAPVPSPQARAHRRLGVLLVVFVLVQLVLGVLVRHWGIQDNVPLLVTHIVWALVVAVVVIGASDRYNHEHRDKLPLLARRARWVAGVTLLQIALGIVALIALAMRGSDPTPTGAELLFATAHQAIGAVLWALTALLTVWAFRLLKPEPAAAKASSAMAP